MANAAPPPPPPHRLYLPPIPDTERQIEILNENDVLLGRGLGPSHFIGNKRFRDLVDSRKAEYNALNSYNEKAVIAWEVYNEVRRRGGRFLKLARVVKEQQGSTLDRGIYEEVPEKKSVEKCKQALREKRSSTADAAAGRESEEEEELPNEPSRRSEVPNNVRPTLQPENRASANVSGLNAEEASGVASRAIQADASMNVAAIPRNAPLPSNGVTQPTLFGSSVVDPRLLILQQPLLALNLQQQALLQQQQMLMQQQALIDALGLNSTRPVPNNMMALPALVTNHVYPHSVGMPVQQGLIQNQTTRSILESRARDILLARTDANARLERSQHSNAGSTDPPVAYGNCDRTQDRVETDQVATTDVVPKNGSVVPPSNDENLIASESSNNSDGMDGALSALAVAADQPRFTEEEEAIEQASTTDEEKASALCDLYGKYSADDIHQKKRSKKQLDRRSIDFLIQFMRSEIENFPVDKKQALMEAREKCRSEEFSDARLEGFLRCEGMNANLAAERFVNYWEARKEVFGPEKFHLPMTLSQALKDDLVAIEAGVHCLLPHPDSFGRRIVFIEPHRHTRKGYTSESLVRAFWYMVEVFVEESGYDGSGFITVVWDLHTSICDYDSRVSDKMVYLGRYCLPFKTMPTHICCLNSLLVRILKPLVKALMNKETRQRFLMHDARPNGILRVLSEFGITKDMLPTEMGGDIQLDQSEWIANRFAIEMEELEEI